jgi:ATP phosphoribosyltransferase
MAAATGWCSKNKENGKMTDPTRLRIAVQKSGRLADPSLAMLEKCGVRFEKSKNQLFCQSKNFAMDLLMLRDDDIPELVNDGACELGIVGFNVYEEKRLEQESRGKPFKLDLAFAGCRWPCPKAGRYQKSRTFRAKR